MSLSFRYFKKYTPKTLLGRVMLILILPTILAQAISIYIFYERHLDHVSRQLAISLSAEIATVTDYIENSNSPLQEPQYLEKAVKLFGFSPKIMSSLAAKEHIKDLKKTHLKLYENALKNRINNQFDIYTDDAKVVTTVIYIADNALVIDTPYKRIVNSTSYIFILWMTGTTLLLLGISIMFLKNQIRPVVRLARLADNLGRGHEITINKPEGAAEVRLAFKAFANMQQNLSRFVRQRTEMLAGISHDLRTPLTRMKLELALQKDKTEFVQNMEKDIKELEHMVNSYIEFARGDEGEEASLADLAVIIEEVAERYKPADIKITAEKINMYMRPNSIKRVVTNIIENALKYAKKLEIKAYKQAEFAVVEFDDNGIGIAPEKREDVFKPFYRIEESRNSETGGIGLGLSVVRDIVNSHGGTVHLEDSALGGLKVVIRLPV